MARMTMRLELVKCPQERSWNFRVISPDDAVLLGELMVQAYRGTVDYHGESRDDARVEVKATLGGKYGVFLRDCSFLIEEEGQIISAVMVTMSEHYQAPLLAFCMTHPSRKTEGMATFLIREACNALVDAGYKELFLVVTEENKPARHIYEKMRIPHCE
jgi:predicted GNAT family acetyltransferase